MGVKGLTTFIKDNRQSLCRSIQLSPDQAKGHERIPVVVDAWGVIYILWMSALPWQSGGEYLRFYRLVCRLVEAWRSVGLEPMFVFDGSAPSEKLDTQLRRLDNTLRTAQLFYTTSPPSRSGPSFSRNEVLLPPFASHTFIHALDDLDVATHFVPLGEADGECVIIAERLGGYVLGQDSDYPILISAPGLQRIRGYCPLEMMMWIEDDPAAKRQEAAAGKNGWTVASGSKRDTGQSSRTSSLLPPTDMRRPRLVMTSIAPNALRQRLRLPATMMPLFGSLVGNDYTPPAAPEHFFEPQLNLVARIEKVARVMREVIFSPNQPQSPTSQGGNAGDNAVDLVKKVILKLVWKPFVSDPVLMSLVEAIIESTFQYILPYDGSCCGIYPFCGELDGGCQSRPPSRVATPRSAEKNGFSVPPETPVQVVRRAYAAAQKQGIMQSVTHAWLYPHRVLLWSVLEDPSGPSLKASEGMRRIREKAYLFAEEGLGGMRWPVEEESDLQEGVKVLEKVNEATGMTDESAQEDDVEHSHPAAVSDAADATKGTTMVDESNPTDPPKRIMIEFVRHTNRYAAFRADLPAQLDNITPTCLQPLAVRLRAFLEPLGAANDLMLALPPHIQPLAAIARFAALEASTRKPEAKWKRSELEAVLKSFIFTLSTWTFEKRSKLLSRSEAELSYPLLTSRHAQIVAQIGVVMTDSIILAQSLLLLPYTPLESTTEDSKASPSGPGRRMPTLTHLTPFLFFSGIALHILLSHGTPPDWEWSEKNEATFQACMGAILHELGGEVLRGSDPARTTHAPPSGKPISNGFMNNGGNGSHLGEQDKRGGRGGRGGRGRGGSIISNVNGNGRPTGRFSVLGSL